MLFLNPKTYAWLRCAAIALLFFLLIGGILPLVGASKTSATSVEEGEEMLLKTKMSYPKKILWTEFAFDMVSFCSLFIGGVFFFTEPETTAGTTKVEQLSAKLESGAFWQFLFGGIALLLPPVGRIVLYLWMPMSVEEKTKTKGYKKHIFTRRWQADLCSPLFIFVSPLVVGWIAKLAGYKNWKPLGKILFGLAPYVNYVVSTCIKYILYRKVSFPENP